MKIEKSFELKHPREQVWSKLNDVRFVAECLPGASIVSDLGENRYKGRMSIKVGPMAAVFNGEIALDSHKQDWTGVVSGKGADSGSSSRASGSMTYVLAEGASPAATRVDIVSQINLAGPLAQFSKGAIVRDIANRITAAFVTNFETCLAEPSLSGEMKAAPVRHNASFDAGGLLWMIFRERLLSFFRRLFGRSSAGS
jgi:carbon monoxide dehydrogenase subunit G